MVEAGVTERRDGPSTNSDCLPSSDFKAECLGLIMAESGPQGWLADDTFPDV